MVHASTCPMGKTSIGSIAKRMSEGANLPPGKHANIPPTDVVQLTGHKNIQSLNSYSIMSSDQQRNISHLLSSNWSRNMPQSVASTNSTTTESQVTPSSIHITSEGCSPSDFLLQTFEIDCDIMNEMLNDDTNQASLSMGHAGSQALQPFSFLNGTTISGNVTVHIHQCAESADPQSKRHKDNEQ